MIRNRCPGSREPGLDGRFPGDSDRCSRCSRNHVRVLADCTLATHPRGNGKPRAGKQPAPGEKLGTILAREWLSVGLDPRSLRQKADGDWEYYIPEGKA